MGDHPLVMAPEPNPAPTQWWEPQASEPTLVSEARLPLDHDAAAFRRGEEAGLLKRFSRHGVRYLVAPTGGSGTSDVVRYGNGIEVNVNNIVLRALRRRRYIADEALVILRASLSCDTVFTEENSPPIAFTRPELTLVCVPCGMRYTVDVRGGVRNQGLHGLFRPGALTAAYGLRPEDFPPVVRDALTGTAGFGRVISLPLDHHVAALVADTIDTPLEGEMRALQYAGRLAELVAYTMDAVRRHPPEALPAVQSTTAVGTSLPLGWRTADLAQLALARLARQYRKPPQFTALARDLGTNPNKLQASFKAAFGITMGEYCLERRMREAQQLLLEGKLSVADVAERVGYGHQSNFAAAFTAHLGMSPREYRRHRAPVHVSLGAAEADLAIQPSRGSGRP